jgi:hypothetical protein
MRGGSSTSELPLYFFLSEKKGIFQQKNLIKNCFSVFYKVFLFQKKQQTPLSVFVCGQKVLHLYIMKGSGKALPKKCKSSPCYSP